MVQKGYKIVQEIRKRFQEEPRGLQKVYQVYQKDSLSQAVHCEGYGKLNFSSEKELKKWISPHVCAYIRVYPNFLNAVEIV